MCWCCSGVTGGRKHFANTRGDGAKCSLSSWSSGSTDVWKLARSGEAAKCVCVCVSLKLARSGDAAKCSLEQFPKICKLIRGLGFRV